MQLFENLQTRLERAFKTLRGKGKISEINIAETVREIRRALLDADVNYKVAKDFTDRVKDKAIGQDVLISVEPGQLLVKIVHDELTHLMGGQVEEVRMAKNPPTVILMAGLQGSGKTTFSGKLARFFKSKGRQPLLVACDVYRPAAIDQLGVLGNQIGVEVYKEVGNADPIQIAKNAVAYAKQKGRDIVIVDTAGRLAIDEEMMDEIAALKAALNPNEILFVVDSMTGQDAVNTAKAFNDRLDFTGVVLTKLDGDSRGGAALSIRSVVEKPIKFISTGEKLEQLDYFYPDRMADRILGMGDIVSLVERAQEQFNQAEAERLQRKIRKNQFDFEDFLSQIQTIEKMGNLKDLVSMIPGVGRYMRDIEIEENAFKHVKAMIQSMTIEERRNPQIMNASRRQRIAKGSGRTIQEVNQLISQFNEMKKMMKSMSGLAAKGRDLGMNLPNMPMLRRRS
jgi:signal recognition particle subunit SRP54